MSTTQEQAFLRKLALFNYLHIVFGIAEVGCPCFTHLLLSQIQLSSGVENLIIETTIPSRITPMYRYFMRCVLLV